MASRFVASMQSRVIFNNLDSIFQSLAGFSISDSKSEKFADSGTRIPLCGARLHLEARYASQRRLWKGM